MLTPQLRQYYMHPDYSCQNSRTEAVFNVPASARLPKHASRIWFIITSTLRTHSNLFYSQEHNQMLKNLTMNKTKPNPQDAGFYLKIQSCLLSLGKTLKSIYTLIKAYNSSGGFVSFKQKGLLKTRVTPPDRVL